MDPIHKFLNIILPPITLLFLIIYLPLYLSLKLLKYVIRHLFVENVAGKVVIVTGAASGIGEQIAYEYAKRGANLVLVDLKGDRLGLVVEKARLLGSPDTVAVTADVSKIEDCKSFVDAAVNHFGKLDHLVNNAGVARSGLFEYTDKLSDFTPMMDVNFWGTVYCTHFAVPHLRNSKGKIVIVSSTCGWSPLPKLALYNASKAAAITFYDTLRTEIGTEVGITIVTPGLITSELYSDSFLRESMSFLPTETVEECGKAIVKSACRGDKYLVEPSWLRVMYPFIVLCPELADFCNRWIFLKRRTTSTKKAA